MQGESSQKYETNMANPRSCEKTSQSLLSDATIRTLMQKRIRLLAVLARNGNDNGDQLVKWTMTRNNLNTKTTKRKELSIKDAHRDASRTSRRQDSPNNMLEHFVIKL